MLLCLGFGQLFICSGSATKAIVWTELPDVLLAREREDSPENASEAMNGTISLHLHLFFSIVVFARTLVQLVSRTSTEIDEQGRSVLEWPIEIPKSRKHQLSDCYIHNPKVRWVYQSAAVRVEQYACLFDLA